MIIPFYLLFLGAAAGIMGIFIQDLLHPLGYAPSLHAAIALTTGVAAIYLFAQLLFFSLLKLFRPSKGAMPYLSECLSQAGALVLLAPLTHFTLPLPHPMLEQVEPFLYLGAFALWHGFFKLLTLFSATQTQEGSLAGFLGWGVASLGCVLVAATAFALWQDALLETRRAALEAAQIFRLGEAYIRAQSINEGDIVSIDLPEDRAAGVQFRWSRHPELEEQVSHAYLTLEFDANPPVLKHEVVPLEAAVWNDLHLAASEIPEGAAKCSIQWFSREQPAWMTQTGLRPPEPSTAQILLTGPYPITPRAEDPDPNIIVIVLDGLGHEHVTHLGYDRNTTPGLDALASRGLSFQNAFTPAVEGAGAVMSLLTGLNPLQHGYLAGHTGQLPMETISLAETLREHGYFTAAFTEGAQPEQEDLYFGSGFERGFSYFLSTYPAAPGQTADRPAALSTILHAGSKVTLDRALAWIEAHRDQKYMALIRLTELQTPRWQSRHGLGFAGPRPSVARPIDRYDTMLQNVDQQLDAFLHAVSTETEEEPLIIILGSYGLDFTEPGRGTWRRGGPGVPRMGESSLRVPLILAGPGVPVEQRNDIRSLLDVTPTIYSLLGIPLPHAMEGGNLLEETQDGRPISVMGSPISMSLRTLQWRYIWHSGRAPFSREMLEEPRQELIDVIRLHNNIAQPANILAREVQTINTFRAVLREYLETHTEILYGAE